MGGSRDAARAPRRRRARRGPCAERVICVSEAARRWYLATGWDRAEHVVVVPNGVAAGRVPPGEPQRLRRALGLAPSDVVVTMLGVLRRGKGHDIAVAAT